MNKKPRVYLAGQPNEYENSWKEEFKKLDSLDIYDWEIHSDQTSPDTFFPDDLNGIKNADYMIANPGIKTSEGTWIEIGYFYANNTRAPGEFCSRLIIIWKDEREPRWSIDFVKKTGWVVNSVEEAKKKLLEIINKITYSVLTKDQEKWINHISDDSKVKIIPFDSSCQEKFEKVKAVIQSKLGEAIEVKHRGATGLGISGQDEIDVYIPVPPSLFDSYIIPLTELFDKPRSHYPLERVRFITSEAGKHIDVFLVNEEHASWLDSVKFEDYLKTHPETLEEYRKLKESGDGLSTREYYRRKVEFINSVLERSS